MYNASMKKKIDAKRTSFFLSQEARNTLYVLARIRGMTMTAYLELLLRETAQKKTDIKDFEIMESLSKPPTPKESQGEPRL